MFAVIPANRSCLTNFVNISPTQFAFSFPSDPHFSHLVVFILPGNTLPPDTAAGVHIQLPGSAEFKFLGAIGNGKPSAVFKINSPGSNQLLPPGGAVGSGDEEPMTDQSDPVSTTPAAAAAAALLSSSSSWPQDTTSPTGGTISLGISVEPVANIQAQLTPLLQSQVQAQSPSSTNAASTSMVVHQSAPSTKVLAQRIIKNAFNFLASFAGGAGGVEVVPLKSFQDWWTKFERRVENDPGFLERDENGG